MSGIDSSSMKLFKNSNLSKAGMSEKSARLGMFGPSLAQGARRCIPLGNESRTQTLVAEQRHGSAELACEAGSQSTSTFPSLAPQRLVLAFPFSRIHVPRVGKIVDLLFLLFRQELDLRSLTMIG